MNSYYDMDKSLRLISIIYPDNNLKYKNRKQAEALYDTLFVIELFFCISFITPKIIDLRYFILTNVSPSFLFNMFQEIEVSMIDWHKGLLPDIKYPSSQSKMFSVL